MNRQVRAAGAAPATVAIIAGVPCVGLTDGATKLIYYVLFIVYYLMLSCI